MEESINKVDLLTLLPHQMHLLMTEVMVAALEQFNYEIGYADYIDCCDGKVPAKVTLDGREWSAVIAVKKD